MLAGFRKDVMVMLLLTAPTCLGQNRRGDVITNIPFPFVVADHVLPPGRYIVTPVGETNLRIYTNKQSVIFPAHSVTGKALEGIGKMVFHRYGGSYFLSEVWVAANSTGRQLFVSKAERELAQRANREVAVLLAPSEGSCNRPPAKRRQKRLISTGLPAVQKLWAT